jgi:hypothetical protein
MNELETETANINIENDNDIDQDTILSSSSQFNTFPYFNFDNDIDSDYEQNDDVIDINIIDNNMCYLIWKDFKEQYRPFTNSLVHLTDYSTHNYFANEENRHVLFNYINRRLIGFKLSKLKPIGRMYFFFSVKRTNDGRENHRIIKLESKIKELTQIVETLEKKYDKLYYAPDMPGYKEAMDEFTSKLSKTGNDVDVEFVE